MTRKQTTITWNRELLKTIKANFGTEDPNEIKKLIYKFLESGSIENLTIKEQLQQKDLELKTKKIENYDYKNRIDKVRAESYETHYKTFGITPSKQGEKAIEKYATRPLNSQEKENLLKLVTIRKDNFNSKLYSAKCNICNEGENYDSYFQAEDDMLHHLQTEHKEKVQFVS